MPGSYLSNTVHAADRVGAVSVRERDGMTMLVISWPQEELEAEDEPASGEADEEYTDPGYETLIYCWEGTLR